MTKKAENKKLVEQDVNEVAAEAANENENAAVRDSDEESNVVNFEGAQAKDASVSSEGAREQDAALENDEKEAKEEAAAEAEAAKEERGQSRASRRPQRRRKTVSLRNPYFNYENPTALIDHCYHTWRISDGQWHRDHFYEKILYSDWTLTLNDIFAMGRLEPDFKAFLSIVQQLIYGIKICDTKYIDGQFQGNEFSWEDMESLLTCIAMAKSSTREQFDEFRDLIQRMPRPIMMKRIKRRAFRYGITDIQSAMNAVKLGIINAKLGRHFCFSFELDPDHRDYHDAFARSTRLPR